MELLQRSVGACACLPFNPTVLIAHHQRGINQTFPKKSDHALRHRLAHGQYFNSGDGGTDYVVQVHRKLINYLNDEFGEELLDNNIVNLHRHPMGSKTQARAFLKPVGAARLHLPNVMAEAVDDIDNLISYESLKVDDYHEIF